MYVCTVHMYFCISVCLCRCICCVYIINVHCLFRYPNYNIYALYEKVTFNMYYMQRSYLHPTQTTKLIYNNFWHTEIHITNCSESALLVNVEDLRR